MKSGNLSSYFILVVITKVGFFQPIGFRHHLIYPKRYFMGNEEFWIINVSTKEACYFLQNDGLLN